MLQYHRSSVTGYTGRGAALLIVALACGCTSLGTGPRPGAPTVAGDPSNAAESPVETHIAFMKQAAVSVGPDRQRMLTDLDRRNADSPVTTRLHRGFLLTSPSETLANTAEGEKILREILAGHSDLDPALRDLVELRLHEVEVRQALRVELGEAKETVKELLSIESSMEQRRTESQGRTR